MNLLLTLGRRHMIPKSLDGCVRASRSYKHRDSSDLSVVGLVHQVNLHLVWLALNVFFTGVVKVELRKLVALILGEHEVAISGMVVYSDRVTVVDHIFKRHTRGFELQGR